MNDTESRAALAGLSGPLPVADAEAVQTQHARIRPQLREFVRGLPARRRKQRFLRLTAASGALALSASLVLAVWHGQATDRQPFIVEEGSVSSLEGEGHRVVTGAAETVTLRTRQGARIAVAARTSVEAVTSNERHEQVVLNRGSVLVQVPHLDSGGTFSVKTPDALVTVHGTVFSVAVSGAARDSQTCVRVTEGVVSVARAGAAVVVKVGQQFNCGETAASRTAAPASARPREAVAIPAPLGLEPAPGRESSVTAQGARAAAAGAGADSTLGEQNRLLSSALQAERAGHYAEAESHVRELIARYPSSALLPDAQRSLQRVQRAQRALPSRP